MKRGSRARAGARRSSIARFLTRLLLALGLTLVALIVSAPYLIDAFAGASRRTALDDPRGLSSEGAAFLNGVYADLDPARLVDYHTHLAGQGYGSECWVNPRMLAWTHPRDWVRFRCYLSAAGVGDVDAEDHEYVNQLARLARAQPHPARHLVLAFDHRYGADGARDLEHSEFYVPNEWAFEVAETHPDVFSAAMSVHPYRDDALAELERWAQRGVRLCKWLPNAMGIDPANERCDDFYLRCAELGVAIVTHAGDELAVEAGEDQALGNPLRLRRALDHGVQVLVAHCASLGEGEDLDQPGAPPVANFELFLRLMGEPRYEALLFGEISTVTQVNRYSGVLAELLRRTDLHPRFVNGSDYPLPAIQVLYSTRKLAKAGYLTADERERLNELYHYNPLVFDLALKRTVRDPETGARFAPEVFHGREGLGL